MAAQLNIRPVEDPIAEVSVVRRLRCTVASQFFFSFLFWFGYVISAENSFRGCVVRNCLVLGFH